MTMNEETVQLYPEARRSWATWTLLVINVLVYIATLVFSLVLSFMIQEPFGDSYHIALYLMGWKDNALIYFQHEYWRLLTATFLHGGLIHLFVNAIGIFIIGKQTEYVYGTLRFVAVYFVSGLAGSLMSYAFNPVPAVGASGALFGIVGALAVFFYTTRNILGEFSRSQLQSVIVLVVLNIFFGLSTSGIDNFGHIGGLIGGLLSGWMLVPRYHIDDRFTPPVLMKKNPNLGWVGTGVLFVVLCGLVFVITPPL
jgi:rhomboid protease GluP